MLTAWGVLSVALAYVLGLFAIAYWGDRRARDGRSVIDTPLIYSLSLAVYCTSWTFYGSVGRAVASGVGFLPIYLGPTLMALLWWFVLRKTVRIAKANNITSLADFLGARYGQSSLLGGVVAVVMVVGITPYIALQLKAISQTFEVLVRYPEVPAVLVPSASRPFYADTAFGTAVILIAFGIMFGARDLDSSRRHEGLVATIAFESLVKLLAFLAVGAFVTYGVFGGVGDLLGHVAGRPEYARMLGGDPAFSYGDWAALTWLSMMAIMFLPRQFHMAVVGNTPRAPYQDGDVDVPGLPPAHQSVRVAHRVCRTPHLPGGGPDGGRLLRADAAHALPPAGAGPVRLHRRDLGGDGHGDRRVDRPVHHGPEQPGGARGSSGAASPGTSPVSCINSKRLAIAFTIWLGYVYYHAIGESYTLVNIGLISFAAVAQFAPAFFGGLYWRRATRSGALAGIGAGFAVWCYTLLLPSFVRSGWVSESLLTAGPFGLGWLRPEQLFGVAGLGFWAHTVFWSLAFNLGAFALVSLYTRASALEAAQADRFVGIFAREPRRVPAPIGGQGPTLELLEEVVARITGREKAQAGLPGLPRRARRARPAAPDRGRPPRAGAVRGADALRGGGHRLRPGHHRERGAGRHRALRGDLRPLRRGLAVSRAEPRGPPAPGPRAVAAQRGHPAHRLHPGAPADDGRGGGAAHPGVRVRPPAGAAPGPGRPPPGQEPDGAASRGATCPKASPSPATATSASASSTTGSSWSRMPA